jgi:hydroxypyruvate isomerase
MSSRREAIKNIALGTLGVASTASLTSYTNEAEEAKPMKLKGNINHSVCYWTHNFLSLDELCVLVKKMGFGAIDLLTPKEWPTVQKHGITCSMCYTGGKISLTEGWIDKKIMSGSLKIISRQFRL